MGLIITRHNATYLVVDGVSYRFPSIRKALNHCKYNGLDPVFKL